MKDQKETQDERHPENCIQETEPEIEQDPKAPRRYRGRSYQWWVRYLWGSEE